MPKVSDGEVRRDTRGWCHGCLPYPGRTCGFRASSVCCVSEHRLGTLWPHDFQDTHTRATELHLKNKDRTLAPTSVVGHSHSPRPLRKEAGNTYCSAWAAMYPKKPPAHHAELNMRKKQETSPQNLGMIGSQINDKQDENTCEVSPDLVIQQTFVSSPSTLQCEETSAVWWTKSAWSILNQAKFVNRARTAEECLNLAEILWTLLMSISDGWTWNRRRSGCPRDLDFFQNPSFRNARTAVRAERYNRSKKLPRDIVLKVVMCEHTAVILREPLANVL